MKQRTAEWMQARCGKITASRFADVLAEPRSKAEREAGELSQSAFTYMLELVSETLTGQPIVRPVTQAMQWGIDWEPYARDVYTEVTGRAVREVGFCTDPRWPRVGCSPDGMVGAKLGLEIKCPYTPEEHLRAVVTGEMPSRHMPQVQGTMWITGREGWDFVSYDPRQDDRAAIAIIRIHREEAFIGRLERACKRLLDRLDETLDRIESVRSIQSATHYMAHLLAPPVTLTYKGEVL